MEQPEKRKQESVHPSTCPNGFVCPGTGVPEKDGNFCKKYNPITKACKKGKIQRGE